MHGRDANVWVTCARPMRLALLPDADRAAANRLYSAGFMRLSQGSDGVQWCESIVPNVEPEAFPGVDIDAASMRHGAHCKG